MMPRWLQIMILIAVAFLGFLVYRGWQEMETTAYMSCIASIQSVMDQGLRSRSEYTEIIWEMLPEDESWTLFRGADVDPIVVMLKPYDCGRSSDSSLDIWGNKIVIALRRSSDTVGSRAWSMGPDEIERTEDDIVMPWGKTIP
ncbi:MAG: hypothetical protein ABIR33_04720 [Pyrinomonadaceae bacterium]